MLTAGTARRRFSAAAVTEPSNVFILSRAIVQFLRLAVILPVFP